MNKTHGIKLPYSGRRKSLGFQSYVVARSLLSNCGVPIHKRISEYYKTVQQLRV